MRKLMVFVLAVVLTAVGVTAQPKAGFADAILGRWNLTVQGADAPYPSWVHIHLRKETELQARFVGRSGSVRSASTITYGDDGRLVFEVPSQYEKNKSPLRFEGRLNGDRLEGTTVDADGGTAGTMLWQPNPAKVTLVTADIDAAHDATADPARITGLLHQAHKLMA